MVAIASRMMPQLPDPHLKNMDLPYSASFRPKVRDWTLRPLLQLLLETPCTSQHQPAPQGPDRNLWEALSLVGVICVPTALFICLSVCLFIYFQLILHLMICIVCASSWINLDYREVSFSLLCLQRMVSKETLNNTISTVQTCLYFKNGFFLHVA